MTNASKTPAAGYVPIADTDAMLLAGWVRVMVGDSGAGGTKGAVPAPAIGDATKFLRGDGTWQTAGGGTAATTSFTPAGGLSSTDVQAALVELDTEKQPIDSDLTAFAALTPTNDDIAQRKGGAWTNRTMAQLLADLAAVGTTFQPLSSNLTTYAGIAPSANVQSLLGAANYAAMKTQLALTIGANVQAWDTDLDTWAAITRASGFDTFVATPSSANLLALLTTKTGTGSAVFGTSPTITGGTINNVTVGGTSVLSTSSSVNSDYGHIVTNTNGGTLATATWSTNNDASANLSMYVRGSGNTQTYFGQTGPWGMLVSYGGNGLQIGTNGALPVTFGANNTEFMRLVSAGRLLIGTTTDDGSNKLQVNGNITASAGSFGSIELGGTTDTTIQRVSAGVISVEGVNVLLNGGALGTPASGVATNLTGTASGLTAGSVTTNANLTGVITSVGNATSIASQTGTGTTFAMSVGPTFTGTVTLANVTAQKVGSGTHNEAFGSTAGNILGASAADNTLFGFASGVLISSGTQNTLVGSSAGATIATVSGLTAVGYQALTTTTIGTQTALGWKAGAAVTTGARNTLIGYNTAAVMTTGQDCTFVGNAVYPAMTVSSSAAVKTVAIGSLIGTLVTTTDNFRNVMIGYDIHTNADNAIADCVLIGNGAAKRVASTFNQSVVIGSAAGEGNGSTAGYNNAVFIGYQAGRNQSGNAGNTCVGSQANGRHAGNPITAFGYQAAYGKASGSGNGYDLCAFGYQTMNLIGSANQSNAFGNYAMLNLSDGTDNNVMGWEAMKSLTTGTQNCGMGTQVLKAITTTSGNTGIGHLALLLATGSNSTAVGWSAGTTIVAGTGLTCFGYEAAKVTTVASNSCFGYQAGKGITTGTTNTIVGYQSMDQATTTGTDNVAVGYRVFHSASATSLSYNVGIGSFALNAATTAQQNVAIGYNALGVAAAVSDCISIGYQSLSGATMTGNQNIAIGTYALSAITSGSRNIALGAYAGAAATTAARTLYVGDTTQHASNYAVDTVVIDSQNAYGATFSKPATFGDRTYHYAPNSAPSDGNILTSGITFYLNEAGNLLSVRVKYSDGTTLKTGTVALV